MRDENRTIVIELCRSNGGLNDATVVSYEELSVEQARERLATKCVNGHFYRISPPCSADPEREERRYEDDKAAVRG